MKKFVAAVKEKEKGEEKAPIVYEVLGKEIAFNHPGNGQMIFLMTSFGADSKDVDRAASVFDLLFSTMSDEDVAFLRAKMLTNEFDETLASDIFTSLVEDWFADPSQPSSDSQPTE